METEVDLRFNKVVDSYVNNPRLLGRQWLVEKVLEELKTSRFLLLTAEPGFGKSTFMAYLAKDNPNWLRYFVQSKALGEQSNVSARQLLINIGFQIADKHPAQMQQNKITLEVEQYIDSHNKGSDLLGISVGTLQQSPFYSQVVTKILQKVGENKGRTRAIEINNVINDPNSLPLADLQELALFGPARQYAGELVLLIDGLHIWQDADSKEDILYWLTNHTGSIPKNIRFVLTTRQPDARWQTFIRRQQASLRHLRFERDDQVDEKPPFHGTLDRDVRHYAEQIWQDELYQPYLSELKVEQAAWLDTAVSRANGNLGYLDMMERSVTQAINQKQKEVVLKQLSLQETPTTLITFFADFFKQIKDDTANKRIEVEDENRHVSYINVWLALYIPLLRVLALASKPLTFAELHQQSNIQVGSQHTAGALDNLTPFLDQTDGRFKLYHPALKEYLLQKELA